MIKVNSDKISLPGEYNLTSLVLTSYNGFSVDLRPNLVELMVNENIYHPSLSGQLMISENVTLLRHLPFIGTERLEVEFQTPSRDVKCKRTFRVYKADDQLKVSETAKLGIYTFYFTTEEALTNQKLRISRAYQNLQYSSMIGSIYNDYLKSKTDPRDLLIEPTLGKKNFVLPYSKPFAAITTLAQLCISQDSKDTTYRFYETFDGFRFTSLNYYRKMNSLPIQIYSEFEANLSIGKTFKDIQKDFSRIESWGFVKNIDTLSAMVNGSLASSFVGVNQTYKDITLKKYGYNPDFFQQTTLESAGILPLAADSYSREAFTDYQVVNNTSNLYSNSPSTIEYEKTLLQRKAHLSQFAANCIEIQVAGDTERRVGDIVRVNLFSGNANKKGDPDVYDPYLSGRFVITGITHMLQKKRHSMKLILQRDSIAEPFPESKVITDE
jgi:hypothetical protein